MAKNKVVTSFIWRFAERFGAQAVAFVVQIVLARLLAPEVYGTIALITVFTAILNVFVDSGLGNALIQKKDADDLDFSTVFYFNVIICLLLYLIMFFAAPYIADAYKDADLIPVIRVLSLTLVISGVKNVQQAYVTRGLQFKRFFFATLGGTLGAAIIGISMAYMGFGVWALVAQQIFNVTVDTIILWITVKWRPKRMFSIERLKVLFSYGWKLLVASLLNTVYSKIRQLIIGLRYSAADLAYYTKGDSFPNFFISNINTSFDSILFPCFSMEQDSVQRVKAMTKKAIKISTYILFPCIMGLAVISEPLVIILLTEKWLPCVFYFRVFCFVYLFLPIQTANLNAIKAMGRSDVFLKLEIIKKVIGLTAMLMTIFISVKLMALSYLVTTLISTYINLYPNKQIIDYPVREQIKDISGNFFIAIIMFLVCSIISFFKWDSLLTMVIQIVVGCIVYIGLSILFKIEAFNDAQDIIKQLFGKKGKE
ncbi:lipopolysaccharide biosynthesis protein [Ruminococcus sp. CLA-AA-H200]|uniref:Lipopolysaccharide biosynthesis protein n=1 Tax=Ruminococcus turbiniformis TaxID=2881258 RepID=A0ABS8FZX4_9FIRM|nr:lipopolysaccharide biosynthesis protein [Ruminococcus turbiniformis]MCC2255189.1 lipopolysaccharide biosynthesis protein [Ruminococcus turbiniformis]